MLVSSPITFGPLERLLRQLAACVLEIKAFNQLSDVKNELNGTLRIRKELN